MRHFAPFHAALLAAIMLAMTQCAEQRAEGCVCIEAANHQPVTGLCRLTLEIPPGANACAACC